jgi:hypothetical protein
MNAENDPKTNRGALLTLCVTLPKGFPPQRKSILLRTLLLETYRILKERNGL